MAEARALAQQLGNDPVRHANNVVALLAFIKPTNPQDVVLTAIKALDAYFLDANDAWLHKPVSQEEQSSAAAVFHEWCQRKYTSFVALLLSLLEAHTGSAAVQVAALATLMEAVRNQPAGKFSNKLFGKVVQALVTSQNVQAQVYSIFVAKFLPCADVRYYTLHYLKAIAASHTSPPAAAATTSPPAAAKQGSGSAKAAVTQQGASAAAAAAGHAGTVEPEAEAAEEEDEGSAPSTASRCPPEDVARNMYDLLSHVQPRWEPEEGEMRSWCLAAEAGVVRAAQTANMSSKARRKRKREQQQPQHKFATNSQQAAAEPAAWANKVMQKKMFSDAWLAFLRTPIPGDIYRKVLTHIHSTVIPNMVNPLLLSDFLTAALDRGGLLGVLGLNGIFLLVTQHGLEYPQFYTRLYGLLSGDVFLSKHRAQFFQLVDTFLSSPLVPAYTVASFAKKLARLALQAPPAGAMLALVFVHNLIRRHPACVVMLHKPLNTQGSSTTGQDVFNDAETDPALTRAVESSLWEITALRNHYAPQVAALTSILDKDLTNRVRTSEVDLEPLLVASYSSLISESVDKRLKNVATAFYPEPPAHLFDRATCGQDFAGWSWPTQDEQAAV